MYRGARTTLDSVGVQAHTQRTGVTGETNDRSMTERPPSTTTRHHRDDHGMTRADLHAIEYASLLEQQNQDRISSLSGKVGAMKELAIQINEEVVTQNRFLEQDLSDSMSRAVERLRTTMRNLEQMVRAGGSNALCYTVLGVVAILFLLHWVFPR
ncbi:hypothetical protein CCYA_CCYA03G0811 [Cyanidiococcus yangmingshanensis]|uniref:t-SNARE coiled-coil homology domain-containing protein n=1 Tax=Cyanidiococcus yangmingshanensis TaxID=2690220 RepID=A0A7J7IPL7_9RHOD|nr:hypothetical protein F1559_005023 [Cyanidiococcus yangmingshanensis]KAK4529954.1 hypothetical protein CCYA_CCYA03G0811 [Cyanidiococcus yangmingshanensis]